MDGSGVIYDPNGLNREELLRLANSRKMVSNFDMSKLGPGGFRVLVDEPSATLPGTRALAMLTQSVRAVNKLDDQGPHRWLPWWSFRWHGRGALS